MPLDLSGKTRRLLALLPVVLAVSCATAPAPVLPDFAPEPGPLTVRELLELPSVGGPQLSPDGTTVVFVVHEPTIDPKGEARSTAWLVASDGAGEPRAVVNVPPGAGGFSWMPDGRALLCVAASGGISQAWIVPLDGGEARRVTDAPKSIAGPVVSPDGEWIAYASDVEVLPRAADAMPAKVIDDLLFRHWDEWRHGLRTHTFLQRIGGGPAVDVSPGMADAPAFSLAGTTEYAFSRDSRTLFFSRGAETDRATSTDSNLYSVPVDGSEPPKRLTPGAAWDGTPVPSPDGKLLAFRSQATPGFESDRYRLLVMDLATGAVRESGADMDRSADEIAWAPDSQSLWVVTEDEGSHALWQVPRSGASRKLFRANFGGLSLAPDGSFAIGRVSSYVRAPEVVRCELGSGVADGDRWRAVTRVNDRFFASKSLATAESVRIPASSKGAGAKDGTVQAWLLKPPGFQAGKRYPMVLFVHGGPQGAWTETFSSSMWNPQIYAARGWIVLALNPHGSTGFGQEFTNQISGDWGGAVFEDCMNACDWAVQQGLADEERLVAMGGSFGGYMMNWFLGHTTRFKALVSHAGLFDLESFYGVTEELWFPEWDLKGRPWDSELYREFSPNRFVEKFETPTLVTHGELDYRVPIGEGIALFQTLQRHDVPSRFVYFPDEGHWLRKARNREIFVSETIAWFERWLGAPASGPRPRRSIGSPGGRP